MEEENGGKIAECGESSITPPVNNSEGEKKEKKKRLLLKLSVPTKMELFLISFLLCVASLSGQARFIFTRGLPLICASDYLQSRDLQLKSSIMQAPLPQNNWQLSTN